MGWEEVRREAKNRNIGFIWEVPAGRMSETIVMDLRSHTEEGRRQKGDVPRDLTRLDAAWFVS